MGRSRFEQQQFRRDNGVKALPDNQIKPGRAFPRRTVLQFAALSAGVLPLLPKMASAAGQDEFASVSRILTDRADLDQAIGNALYRAHADLDAQFASKVSKLMSFIKKNNATSATMDGLLKDHAPDLAPVAQQIASGWYLGIVGEGKDAKTVTYTNCLANLAVADVLTPPSYGYGSVYSWAEKPVQS